MEEHDGELDDEASDNNEVNVDIEGSIVDKASTDSNREEIKDVTRILESADHPLEDSEEENE